MSAAKEYSRIYADDISLVCGSAEKLRKAITVMDATFLRWGLTHNQYKEHQSASGWQK